MGGKDEKLFEKKTAAVHRDAQKRREFKTAFAQTKSRAIACRGVQKGGPTDGVSEAH